MKQTAVNEIIDMCYTIIKNSTDYKVIQTAKLIIFRCENEFKEMEKKQIKNSYLSGTIDGFNFRTTSISPDSEQYYNETFKNK